MVADRIPCSFAFALAVAAGAVAATAFADDPYLMSTDVQGKTSFTDGARWSDGNPPSTEKDYIVASGRTIRTPAKSVSSSGVSTNAVFAGRSLTLGNNNGGGNMVVKTTAQTAYRGNAQVTIGDLRLVNAASYITQGGDQLYSSLYGKITFSVPMASVEATSAPYFELSAGRAFDVYSDLHAASGCGFVVKKGNDSAGRVVLRNDNPNFLGYMAVQDDKVYLTAETSGALGPEPAEPTVLLNLRAGGAFGTEGLVSDNVVIDQPKRGISVTSETGGRLYAASGKSLTTSMFITTEATKRPLKKIGAGSVFVTGACDVGDIEIQEGRLGLAGDVASDIVVSNNAYLAVASADSTLTLSGAVTFKDSSSRIMFQKDGNGRPSGTIVLDEGFTSSAWPLNWQVAGSMPDAAVGVALFRVHPSVRRVSPGDFFCQNAMRDGYSRKYEVTMDEDGMQVVKWVQYADSSVVRMKAAITGSTDDDNHKMLNLNPWEDDAAPSPGKNYLVDATTAGSEGTGAAQSLRTGNALDGTAVFPGDSLTLKGSSSYIATFMLKAKETIVTNLIVSGTAEVNISAYYGTGNTSGKKMQTLGGTLQVANGSTLQIRSTNTREFTLASQLSGSGSVNIRPTTVGGSHTAANDNFTVYMTGDNTAFCGKIDVLGHSNGPTAGKEYVAAGTYPVTLRMADGKNLGGDCNSQQVEGFFLRGACRLWPTASMTISGVNRCVKFDGNAFLEVDEGQTLTIESPVAWVGNVYKQGAGTLALGNAREMNTATNSNCLDVVAGMVKTTTTNGMNRIQARLHAGTSIAVEAGHAAGTPLGDFGYYNVSRDDPFDLTAADGTLAVMVEDMDGNIAAGNKAVVNLLTVSATAADALEGHIEATSAAGKKGVVTRNAADTEGRVTFTATFNIKGLMLIVR